MKIQFLVISFILCQFIAFTNVYTGNTDNLPGEMIFSIQLSPVTAASDVPRDYGDAPRSYGSADHTINTKVCLGSLVDAEPADQPSEEADADDLYGIDDEDGVTFPEMIQGKKAVIQVKVTGLAYLNIWIDWNGDGDFLDNDEYVHKNSLRSTGVHNITVTVPENAIISKPAFARFRLGPSATVKPAYGSSGSAGNGEVEDYMIKIQCVPPSPPKIESVTQPTCEEHTGSVLLSGLPEPGTWTLTRLPDGVITPGKGKTVLITGLQTGIYRYIVTNDKGCSSSPSDEITIDKSPQVPIAPLIGIITQPDCEPSTGSVVLNGLPESGEWILTRYPDMVVTTGTGTGTTITGLDPGTYKFTVSNTTGCTSPTSDDIVILQGATTPPAPVIETITQPTCIKSTGQVVLTGLPSSGLWTLFRYPDGSVVTGTGISTTVSVITSGTYKFNVTSNEGCTSAFSSEVVIEQQPPTPSVPLVSGIIQPSCTIATGNVMLSGLPATGSWTLTRYPGTVKTSGTGITTTITGLSPGSYNYTVTNSSGCTSLASENIIITVQPVTPSAPVAGTITQPTCIVPTGTLILTNLPPQGTWILFRYPDGISLTGSGTSITLSELLPGTYNFTVTNSVGCTSVRSSDVVIDPQPSTTPVIKITNPEPVCSPETVNLTNPSVTMGSTEGLIFTYWKDPQATIPYNTPSQATAGTWYIKGTTSLGCYGIKPVHVEVFPVPEAQAGPDQVLKYKFDSQLDANYPDQYSSGKWSIISGSGTFSDENEAKTFIEKLALGENVFMWRVDNRVCPPAEDYIVITVNDLVIPTLIIPDMDGKNDYFILEGIESLGQTQIVIFDRRGMLVYRNDDYDNSWYGLDDKGHPLPGDTYFYVIRSESGFSTSGFIVVKR
ncbi:MAG TPA: gliding motility-associated C-terminal domain-containing protein [Bacteroidales bacterium]|jgi:gliding motility-associated-like protein|nr:T9SS type B sorting domain-containing protein [Bacteroidales bacterium]OQB64050.1 MAG: hypothetical protein BWX96_00823 [Bacteroidetes bacterium ADurb.Bin145]HOU02183.1 gliding motility-associated C-terminal domain-containing protein [Bacteroidales bacterium]HQG63191.1 gliding motility-associated C-terminal domain-containing protein [Bacteroidales bacterium]HQK68215.1 gliding motility-associated C-terminal domain-containing protein [Bacteroidales bacterium]